ncbi:hypothetical protein QOZ80_9AG0692590 [Eleusine coracana subsp. coracana]|nr:hypothetical protein QOZ80_9AG0692590 [Eleusine coracana subsp. coracana]
MEMVLHQPRGSGGGARASTTACRGDPAAQPAAAAMKKEEEEEEEEDGGELRQGPWTVDEDLILINYIAEHGEGRWNALARAAGLKRTGKSCRLRWLNYLRPDVKRGDFTADEQLLILDLHSRWGNRWSKIAQQLPGRTDNEIKNYWRTRVQKHARQLGCDVGSRRFKDAMTYLWMPRLAERASAAVANSPPPPQPGHCQHHQQVNKSTSSPPCLSALTTTTNNPACLLASDYDKEKKNYYHQHYSPGVVVPSSSSSESSSLTSSTEEKNCWTMQGDDEFWSTAAPPLQELTMLNNNSNHHQFQFQEDLTGWVQGFSDADHNNSSLWTLDDIWRMH